MRRRVTGIGTVVVALAGLLAAPLASGQVALLALTTGIAVAVGSEAHARLHPRFGPVRSRQLDGFWIGPALAAFGAGLISGEAEGVGGRAAAVVGAGLVAGLLAIQDRELDDRGRNGWLPLVFALLLYVIAFELFVAIYGSDGPMFVDALGTGLTAMLLAMALFRQSRAERARTLVFAAATGLTVAELTLALGTWVGIGLLGGAFLLLFFYVAAGLIQALLDGNLSPRMLAEYGGVGVIGLGLILSTSPWRI